MGISIPYLPRYPIPRDPVIMPSMNVASTNPVDVELDHSFLFVMYLFIYSLK